MQSFKRIGLFLALNIVIVLTLSTIMSLLGANRYLYANGLNLQSLAIYCLVWGMGGAFISLALSRKLAKWTMGVQLVPDNTYDARLVELKQTVHQLSREAGIKVMPEVGVYESPELNAFATGPSKNRSLVAVSSGLLRSMDRRELRGVLAHEVAHIANGDMVTMTLLQGVVNAFVMFLARIIAYGITQATRSNNEESPSSGGFAFMGITFVLELIFMVFGSIIVAAYSRRREYRADAGGARLGGRENMIAALQGLKKNFTIDTMDSAPNSAVAAMQIENHKGKGLSRFFSTHPDLDDRIARLQLMQVN
ncbi:MAG: protease HtpX [Oligoflexus sp.]|nr:protease HtpX [Oligoflexus sp.]